MSDTKIAGLKKISHWTVLKDKLQSDPSEKLWCEAFDDFLVARVTTRYYDPIKAIAKISAQQGKGFSIIAIYCSLIEFYETLLKGYHYESQNYKDNAGIVKSKTRKDNHGRPAKLSSKEVFIHFLTENEPFKSNFNVSTATDFYEDVRCAILHQAQTAGNWVVRDGKESDSIIDINTTAKILQWRPLEKSFEIFLKSYGSRLKTDTNIQENFIFKFDKISNL